MKAEQLILKKVKHCQVKGKLLFDVVSLREHFDGLLIHKTDVIVAEEGELVKEYIKHGDVNFDNAVAKEVVREFDSEPISEESNTKIEGRVVQADYKEETETTGMTYAEAEELMKLGKLVKLPEWEGFWFQNLLSNQVLVLTKEGEVLDTPWDICKERNDWVETEATPEQTKIIENYFAYLESLTKIAEGLKSNTEDEPLQQIEVVVTEETLEDNPELVSEGVLVGETITVDAVETISEDENNLKTEE